MTEHQQLDYVVRATDRLREASVAEARSSQERILVEAAKVGRGGNTVLKIKQEYVRIVRDAVIKTIRLTFDATGSTAPAVCSVVEETLLRLRDALSNGLSECFRNLPWASSVSGMLGNDYLNETEKAIRARIDDFRHGILDGARLKKDDPSVSMISSVTNSPGAIVQTGLGNVQNVLLESKKDEIRTALSNFMGSREVQSLASDDRQGLADVTEVILTELERPSPDKSKLTRWGKHLLDFASQLGIAVAASGLSHILFGQ